MTQIEQLQVIIHKEIKQKQWMLDTKNDTKCSNAYFSGCLASLRYLKYVLDKMINESK
jgi:hypothetical protein